MFNNNNNNDDNECFDNLSYLADDEAYASLYYDLLFNWHKYYQYYLDGTLEEKLKKIYNPEDIKLASLFLEEKGQSLTRSKNN